MSQKAQRLPLLLPLHRERDYSRRESQFEPTPGKSREQESNTYYFAVRRQDAGGVGVLDACSGQRLLGDNHLSAPRTNHTTGSRKSPTRVQHVAPENQQGMLYQN